MSQISELEELIARKQAAVLPLLSELGVLRQELRKLQNSEVGVAVGQLVDACSGKYRWVVTKIRRMASRSGGSSSYSFHLYGRMMLASGMPSKHIRYIGILGYNCKLVDTKLVAPSPDISLPVEASTDGQ